MNRMIKMHSIFESISGEAGFFPQGTWCTFIRFQGCNLNCKWCDTPSARSPYEGVWMSIDQILLLCNNRHVLITGGEPLMQQKELVSLIHALTKRGHKVQVETNGSYKIPTGPKAGWVVDHKCASSGMSDRMPYLYSFGTNMWMTRSIVKFVLDTQCEADIEQALMVMRELRGRGYGRPFIISPVDGRGEDISRIVAKMAEYSCLSLLENIIFSVQVHKLVDLP